MSATILTRLTALVAEWRKRASEREDDARDIPGGSRISEKLWARINTLREMADQLSSILADSPAGAEGLREQWQTEVRLLTLRAIDQGEKLSAAESTLADALLVIEALGVRMDTAGAHTLLAGSLSKSPEAIAAYKRMAERKEASK